MRLLKNKLKPWLFLAALGEGAKDSLVIKKKQRKKRKKRKKKKNIEEDPGNTRGNTRSDTTRWKRAMCFLLILICLSYLKDTLADRKAVTNEMKFVPAKRGLLSNVFGDHMVFQHDAPIVLWGFVTPGTVVRVSFGNATGSGTGDATGFWRASLPSFGVSGPYTAQAVVDGSPNTNATLVDIYVGSVFICSGQSNTSGATTPLAFVFNSTPSAEEANSFPQLRVFTVGEQAVSGWQPPQQQLGFSPYIPWSVSNQSVALKFSGMCWMAAKVLVRELGPSHAIGFIESAWSGTCIQGWLPAAALESCGSNPPRSQGWQSNSTLFNQMVAPFAQGWSAAGFMWGQGESNAIYFREGYYKCGLTALMSSWRAAFNNPAAHWGVMQLAPWSGFSTSSQAASTVREEQSLVVAADPHATLATEIDLGDVASPLSDIHNRPKQALGARLAAGALLDIFGIGALENSQGPAYSHAVSGGGPAGSLRTTVFFSPPLFSMTGSLILGNISSWPGVLPAGVCPGSNFDCAGFEVQDAGGVWHAAQASLNADRSALVLVAPSGVESVVATRYGQGVWPLASLFASESIGGLPAYPWAARTVGGSTGGA